MRVLVIGSGAREHALLLALRQDPEVEELAIAPGNAGTAIIADQYDVDVTSGEAVAQLGRRIGADLVVIGPEVPLVLGVADTVRAAGIACFGPTKDAARIEGSKSFAKDVMTAAGVRTAASEIVDTPAHLDAALDRFGPSAGDQAWVVKDDGLAAGKGVVVTEDRYQGEDAADLVDVEYDVLPVVVDMAAATDDGAASLSREMRATQPPSSYGGAYHIFLSRRQKLRNDCEKSM